MQPIARRSLLRSGAFAVCLGLCVAWPRAGQDGVKSGPESSPVTGFLAAWVALDLERGATVRPGHFGAPATEIAARDYDRDEVSKLNPGYGRWDLPQSAGRSADRSSTGVARSWRYPHEGCRIEPGRIVCFASRPFGGAPRVG
jgi:hypothetical protein